MIAAMREVGDEIQRLDQTVLEHAQQDALAKVREADLESLEHPTGPMAANSLTVLLNPDDLDLPQHVLRFWETRFAQIKPMKRSGGRRYDRPDDVDLLKGIRRLLYGEGYTIRGVQRILPGPLRAAEGGVSLRLREPQSGRDEVFVLARRERARA